MKRNSSICHREKKIGTASIWLADWLIRTLCAKKTIRKQPDRKNIYSDKLPVKQKEKDESRFSNVQGSHRRNDSLGTVLDSLVCCPDSSPPCHPFQVWSVHSPCCWDYWWLTGCSWFPPHLPPQYCPVDGNHPTVHNITPLPCCNPHRWCLLPWPN